MGAAVIGARQARDVLRRNGRSFYFASLLLGPRHGERAARLYALCRTIDDIADEADEPATASARLAALSGNIAAGDRSDPVAAQALALATETGMNLNALQALIEGVRSDLRPVRMADEAGLLDYAYAVAGTVGLMMCAILDVDDERAYPFAIDLGIAMQLTNIARDVGADARMDRRYLPAEWIGDVAPAAILAPAQALAGDLQQAVRRLLSLAERYYESGEAGLGFLPLRARLSILTAARVYRAIGSRIAAGGHKPWLQRAIVSDARKAVIGLQACASFAARRRLHRRDAVHDRSLHASLQRRPGTHS